MSVLCTYGPTVSGRGPHRKVHLRHSLRPRWHLSRLHGCLRKNLLVRICAYAPNSSPLISPHRRSDSQVAVSAVTSSSEVPRQDCSRHWEQQRIQGGACRQKHYENQEYWQGKASLRRPGVRTGNGFRLQLRCEQSRVLLGLPELRLLVGEKADSASAGRSICAALQQDQDFSKMQGL
jgi:hypothetical protein